MKNINIVCNYSSVYGGNFIPSMFELAKTIKNDAGVIFSFPISAKNRYWVSYLKENGFEICFFRNSSKIAIITDIKRINKSHNVNCLYSHFLSIPIVKCFCLVSKRIELIIHIHSDFRCGDKKTKLLTKMRNYFFDKFFRKDTRYIYVSETLMNEDNNSNSFYIRNALCTNRIISRHLMKSDHSFENESIKVLMFGWSPETKGVDLACKAFLELPDNIRCKYTLYIVTDENGVDKCVNYINQKLHINVSLNKDIVFIEPREDVFDLYNKVDIFISASRSEGFSYSILEALYHGLCVLSSNIDGTRWSSNYGAELFNVDDTNELSYLLSKYSNHTFIKGINMTIVNDFSIEVWVEKIAKLLLNS